MAQGGAVGASLDPLCRLLGQTSTARQWKQWVIFMLRSKRSTVANAEVKVKGG